VFKESRMDKTQAYKKEFEAKLAETRATIDLLKARAKGASAKVELEAKKQIEDLELAFDHLKQESSRLAEKAAESFDRAKRDLDQKWDAYVTRVGVLRKRLSDKESDSDSD
jgi:hypothetical protein